MAGTPYIEDRYGWLPPVFRVGRSHDEKGVQGRTCNDHMAERRTSQDR